MMWLAALWLIIASAAAAWAEQGGQDSAVPAAGLPAPDFELALFTGKKIALKDFRGRAVIIDFWRAG